MSHSVKRSRTEEHTDTTQPAKKKARQTGPQDDAVTDTLNALTELEHKLPEVLGDDCGGPRPKFLNDFLTLEWHADCYAEMTVANIREGLDWIHHDLLKDADARPSEEDVVRGHFPSEAEREKYEKDPESYVDVLEIIDSLLRCAFPGGLKVADNVQRLTGLADIVARLEERLQRVAETVQLGFDPAYDAYLRAQEEAEADSVKLAWLMEDLRLECLRDQLIKARDGSPICKRYSARMRGPGFYRSHSWTRLG